MRKSVVISKERMKNMEKPKYEIIVFDEADIMTASVAEAISNGIPIIWLTKESVDYYNLYNTDDAHDIFYDPDDISVEKAIYLNGTTAKENIQSKILPYYSQTYPGFQETQFYMWQNLDKPETDRYTPVTNEEEVRAVYEWLLKTNTAK